MTDDDRRLAEDAFVAQVLILSKQIEAEDAKKGYNSKSPIVRALELIAKQRSQILVGRP
jgi:hypothetical protein